MTDAMIDRLFVSSWEKARDSDSDEFRGFLRSRKGAEGHSDSSASYDRRRALDKLMDEVGALQGLTDDDLQQRMHSLHHDDDNNNNNNNKAPLKMLRSYRSDIAAAMTSSLASREERGSAVWRSDDNLKLRHRRREFLEDEEVLLASTSSFRRYGSSEEEVVPDIFNHTTSELGSSSGLNRTDESKLSDRSPFAGLPPHQEEEDLLLEESGTSLNYSEEMSFERGGARL